MRMLALVMVLAGLIACGSRVAPIPQAARMQVPAEGGPTWAWRASGRLELDAHGRRLSADVHLRCRPDQAILIAIIADGGITLLSGSVTDDDITIANCVEDLRPHAQAILALADAYRSSAVESNWVGEHREARIGKVRRAYGGDPVLLRRIDGHDWPIRIEDYRRVDDAWIAHALIGEAPWGVAVSIRLRDAHREP
jgi:hypothetical protein